MSECSVCSQPIPKERAKRSAKTCSAECSEELRRQNMRLYHARSVLKKPEKYPQHVTWAKNLLGG